MQQGEPRGDVVKQQSTFSFRLWFDTCYRIALLGGILETQRQAVLLSQPPHAGSVTDRGMLL